MYNLFSRGRSKYRPSCYTSPAPHDIIFTTCKHGMRWWQAIVLLLLSTDGVLLLLVEAIVGFDDECVFYTVVAKTSMFLPTVKWVTNQLITSYYKL
jgi:hypothetical protein